MDSIEWLNVAGRRMGIPYLEYACMPMGELSDLYDFYMASEGAIKLREKLDDEFIPDVR